jgi:hypothetical protein
MSDLFGLLGLDFPSNRLLPAGIVTLTNNRAVHQATVGALGRLVIVPSKRLEGARKQSCSLPRALREPLMRDSLEYIKRKLF